MRAKADLCFEIELEPHAAYLLKRNLQRMNRGEWLRRGLEAALESFIRDAAGEGCGPILVKGGTVKIHEVKVAGVRGSNPGSREP